MVCGMFLKKQFVTNIGVVLWCISGVFFQEEFVTRAYLCLFQSDDLKRFKSPHITAFRLVYAKGI